MSYRDPDNPVFSALQAKIHRRLLVTQAVLVVGGLAAMAGMMGITQAEPSSWSPIVFAGNLAGAIACFLCLMGLFPSQEASAREIEEALRHHHAAAQSVAEVTALLNAQKGRLLQSQLDAFIRCAVKETKASIGQHAA